MKKETWKAIYISKLIIGGLNREDAEANFDSGDHDFTENPLDAANDELSYMGD